MRRSAIAKKRFPLSTRWPLDLTGWCFSCKATVWLPLLPGGAIILCHFWNKVVFKQSRGDNAYALCLDISSCIGSKITHNCKRTTLCYEPAVSQESSSLPVLPVLEHARARARGFSELSIRSASAVRSNGERSMSARYCINSHVRFYANFSFRSKSKRSIPHLTHFVCSYNSGFIYCDMLRTTLLSSHQHERKKLING